jgi:hypothetical protein
MPTFLVESYAPRISEQTCARLEQEAREAVRELAAEGRQIAYLSSIFIREDETCFHLFEAPSARAIAELSRRAGHAEGRVVEAVEGR